MPCWREGWEVRTGRLVGGNRSSTKVCRTSISEDINTLWPRIPNTYWSGRWGSLPQVSATHTSRSRHRPQVARLSRSRHQCESGIQSRDFRAREPQLLWYFKTSGLLICHGRLTEEVQDGIIRAPAEDGGNSERSIIKNNNTVGNPAQCSCEGTILLDLYTSSTMFGLFFFGRGHSQRLKWLEGLLSTPPSPVEQHLIL